jgi:hypothetical protein
MSKPASHLPADLAQHRVLTIAEASAVTSLSPDALRRNHPDKIIQLGMRRQGIAIENVLRITRGEAIF